MFVVDTNILLQAASSDFPDHKRCRDLLERWRGQPTAWYLTWSIIYEFLRVSTHPQVFERSWTFQGAWGFIESLLASPGLNVLVETPRHAQVAAQTVKEVSRLEGNLAHDGHIAILMREHGIRRIHTQDADFTRFPFLEVVDPLA